MLHNQPLLAHEPRLRAKVSGFGLLEILVGLLIGLLATLVIMQVFSMFEEQKRTTTGTADAQTSGSMALYAVKRDIEMAGYGIPVFSSANSPLRCATLPAFNHDGSATTPDIDAFPVLITDGGTGSDRIAIRYSRIDSGGIPVKISGVTVAGSTALVAVTNNMGCQVDDWVVISDGAVCEVAKVSNSVADLPAYATRTDWTQIPLTTVPTLSSGSIACIGKYQKDPPYDDHSSPMEYLYWIENGQLVQGGNPATSGTGTPVMAGIVSIQAQYGISATPSSNRVVQWVEPTGATWGLTRDVTGALLTPSRTDRNRIKAIRIAIVARNGLMEKTNVTDACSSITSANPTGLCAWDATSAAPTTASPAPAIDLSADADWRRYRYRVFETIIPLRSMIWSKESF